MKICIIKLGADGDVLRTLPLAMALKKEYSEAKITWVTKGDIFSLINNLSYIDKVKVLPYNEDEEFDLLYNFDCEKEATELAIQINAEKKYGFYSNEGYPIAFNSGAEYYLNTMFDDELKKKNKKTYQEMMFMAAEMDYKKYGKEEYELILMNEDKKYADDFLKINKIERKKLIGIHMGAGKRWPSKAWHLDRIKEFILKAKERKYEIILFGGPNEIEKQDKIVNELEKEKIKIYRNNPANSKREFASLVNICEAIVCSDSFALHVSIGLKKKTIGLFFVTSPYEVENYGLLTKIISPKLKEFFPEKSDEYNEELTKSISADEVLEELK